MSTPRPHAEGNGDRPPGLDPSAAGRRRTPWPLAVVAVLFVVVPFLTWYWTWFGRSLGDEEITKYLGEGKPRHAQHALSQVAERIERGDAGAGRWNAQVVGLASSPSADVRMTAAWVMGVEHRSEQFRESLAGLLEDPEPIVRRNAALALVRFGDARCRPELLAMLRPHAVVARTEGTAVTALTAGSNVKRESLLVSYTIKPNMVEEVRSPLPGVIEKAQVKDGDRWPAGAELFVIAPDAEQVSDALVGLMYFGGAEELPDVERYARGVGGMPADVKTKAALTAEAIKRRVSQNR
jgi:hypothetical protein